MARLISQRLADRLQQPVVIENRPGATGGIGAALVARSDPDGHTLLFGGVGANAINHALSRSLPYDSERDFAPVSLVVDLPFILVVPASSPALDLQRLIVLGRANPGTLNFGSVGIGSAGHLAGELVNILAGTKFVHIPYKGGAPALLATIAGEVSMMFNTGLEIAPHLKSGRLRAIGMSSAKRSPVAPELPTLAEQGLPGFDVSAWFGVLAPAGTPRPIVDRLNRELASVLSEPETRGKFTELMAVPAWNTPEQFAALISTEIGKYTKVARSAGISAN